MEHTTQVGEKVGYEYIRIKFDWRDLEQMNRLSNTGWKVVAVIPMDPRTVWKTGEFQAGLYEGDHWALLERPL